MQSSVEVLKASNQIDIATMGIRRLSIDPDASRQMAGRPRQQMGEGRSNMPRAGLASQPNNTPLSADEPSVVPLTKCGLLDASVRKCFNSTPPIPMKIDVQEQPEGFSQRGSARHQVGLDLRQRRKSPPFCD